MLLEDYYMRPTNPDCPEHGARTRRERYITSLENALAAADRVAEVWCTAALDAGVGVGKVWAEYLAARAKVERSR
jgi:hypothetical protein